MRGLLLFLMSVFLLSAEISVYASQIEGSSTVRYSVSQRDVSNGHLQLVLKKGTTQLMVTDVQDFNGVTSGFFTLADPGTYRLAALEETTGDYGEAEFSFAPPQPNAPPQEPANPIIRGVPDYLFWLALIVAVIVVFLLIFGNPLTQARKK
jgi:hypothetical protein